MSKRQEGSPAGQTRSTAPPKSRKRPHMSIRVSNQVYAEIQVTADRAGRSLSEEVERRLESAAEWNAMFGSAAAFKAKFEADHEELEHGDTEAVLPRRGYIKVFDPGFGGHAWVPPGQLPAVSEQIVNQAEFREFQAAKKAKQAAEEAIKGAPFDQQLEDLERQMHSLRLAYKKDESIR